ncbi:MAG: dTDP-4-dehydrorhamnose 3,5-epimerase [Methylotenera sp.]
MMRFDCFGTPLAGLKVVQRKPIEDTRGFLSRFYCAEEFKSFGLNKPISQINHTLTRQKGAVRGLHYQQKPYAEIKLVSCLKGKIFDVAVDLRKSSPTFLHWHGEVLSENNHRSLLIPEGFAHGFQTLTEDCELVYLHTAPYVKEAEAALNINDPKIGITWTLDITELSERDRSHPMIKNDFEGIVV